MPFERGDCPDDPDKMREGELCLVPLSKDVKGKLEKADAKTHKCGEPECETLVTSQTMALDLSSQKSCDGKEARLLDGQLVVKELVHAIDAASSGRGFHSGRFEWQSSAGLVVGELSGLTNAGLVRKPAFDACERCRTERIDTGRFCGTVEKAEQEEFEDARVFGLYRLRFTRQSKTGGFLGGVVGTWEGVVVRPCRD
jgi:hypothetical protein